MPKNSFGWLDVVLWLAAAIILAPLIWNSIVANYVLSK
jgi:hypothetical protein